jgi:hypothetical protein
MRALLASLSETSIVAAFLCLSAASCSDKSARLNPNEALRYKHELAQKHYRELSPALHREFLYSQGYTRGAIDDNLERLVEQHRRDQERERARFLESRKESEEEKPDEEAEDKEGATSGPFEAGGGRREGTESSGRQRPEIDFE